MLVVQILSPYFPGHTSLNGPASCSRRRPTRPTRWTGWRSCRKISWSRTSSRPETGSPTLSGQKLSSSFRFYLIAEDGYGGGHKKVTTKKVYSRKVLKVVLTLDLTKLNHFVKSRLSIPYAWGRSQDHSSPIFKLRTFYMSQKLVRWTEFPMSLSSFPVEN